MALLNELVDGELMMASLRWFHSMIVEGKNEFLNWSVCALIGSKHLLLFVTCLSIIFVGLTVLLKQ